MNMFFKFVGVIALLISATIPAQAANDMWNRVFHDVTNYQQGLQGDNGTAYWAAVRPDNGVTMHFEHCEHDPQYRGGWRCRYEITGAGTVVSTPNARSHQTAATHNPADGWNGAFPSASQAGGRWEVVRPDNGVAMFFEHCEQGEGGWHCLHEVDG